jgi:hypothetical protein
MNPRVYSAAAAILVSRKAGDHFLREPVEVSEGGGANDAVEAGIALLDRLQLLDDVLRSARQETPGLTASSIVGNLTVPTSFGSRIAAICSSVNVRTRRNSPNIFVFSS